jgi:hypothetical protein
MLLSFGLRVAIAGITTTEFEAETTVGEGLSDCRVSSITWIMIGGI